MCFASIDSLGDGAVIDPAGFVTTMQHPAIRTEHRPEFPRRRERRL
jgi:hypothetical protein